MPLSVSQLCPYFPNFCTPFFEFPQNRVILKTLSWTKFLHTLSQSRGVFVFRELLLPRQAIISMFWRARSPIVTLRYASTYEKFYQKLISLVFLSLVSWINLDRKKLYLGFDLIVITLTFIVMYEMPLRSWSWL